MLQIQKQHEKFRIVRTDICCCRQDDTRHWTGSCTGI